MTVMNNLLYIIASFLILMWAIGYLVLDINSTIHFVLVLAVLVIIVKIINGKKI